MKDFACLVIVCFLLTVTACTLTGPQIREVDGHKYAITVTGGICHHNGCKCIPQSPVTVEQDPMKDMRPLTEAEFEKLQSSLRKEKSE